MGSFSSKSLAVLCLVLHVAALVAPRNETGAKHHSVLILGGGVAGVVAARTLHERGIRDFLILEARSELGGRLKSREFAGKTVELGANWIQGTQVGNGPANPILKLAKKHGVKTRLTDLESLGKDDHSLARLNPNGCRNVR